MRHYSDGLLDDLDDDLEEDEDDEFDEDDDDEDGEDDEDEDVETWQVSESHRSAKGRSLLDFGH